MSLSDAVDACFESHQVPLLRRLVEQPSYTERAADVEAAQQILDAECQALGLCVERHSGGDFADHRVYRTPGCAADAPGLALVGHMDTVFPPRLGFLHFEREGDVIRGPGVLDMKSGLTLVLFALRALRQVDPARFATLKARFVCVSDEEIGSLSSAGLYARLAPLIRGALVFEAGRLEDAIVVARKGSAVFTLRAQGRAAHAGNRYFEGVSAVHALSLAIPKVEALSQKGGVTANVGLITGGTARNTVPDEAHCLIDVRFTRAEQVEPLRQALQQIADAPLPGRLAGARVELEGRISRPPMEATEASRALLEAYATHARPLGFASEPAPLQGGGSDANLLAARGVPCIDGLGPFGRNFHRVDEWSSLDSLRRRTIALAHFLAAHSVVDVS